jgi:DNA (cytosine-5)-methyltransferase 1
MNAELSPIELIRQARARYTIREVAQHLDINESTLRRWQIREEVPSYRDDSIRQRLLPLLMAPANDDAKFTFIDLFAGIGGIRHAFQEHGGRCVFTSEWNTYAQKTYLANFPHEEGHVLEGDITKVDANDVPDHDVLLAGFPCQPFSIAGVSKKNALGRPHGFEDTTQGTLFYDVARIIATKKPKAFLLENVKNLISHDKGNTFSTILRVLREELGYEVHFRVIDGRHFVPQHRERIIIVGFREPAGFTWEDLKLPEPSKRMSDILQSADEVDPKYTLTPKLWNYLKNYAAKHKAAGNGFGYGLVKEASVARTLSARYYKDGSEILVAQGPRKRPRRLTPRECARLMGFPKDFKIPVSDTQAYKQFGNSVIVPVIAEVARIMVPRVMELILRDPANSDQQELLLT